MSKSRLSFEEYLVRLALVVRERSQDTWRQVGAVCATQDNRIIACGYNGLAPGIDPPEGLYDDRENPLRQLLTIHAEVNALALCRRGEVHTIAVSTLPCGPCASSISAYGIKRVLYWEDYHRDDRAKETFQRNKIECLQVCLSQATGA